MFVEAIEDILAGQCTPAVVRTIESGGSPAALWGDLTESGFLELLASEDAGGAELPLPDLFPIIAKFGRHAVPVPAPQSIAARALLRAQGLEVPAGMITLASSQGSPVPFGAICEFVVADQDGAMVLLDCVGAQRIGTGVPGSLAATLRWKSSRPMARIEDAGAAVTVFGAALHAALIAGAMERVFEMTLRYGNDRTQFGKSIGRFQAIQHQLSVMAEHVAAAGTAAELAFASDAPLPQQLPTAIAKARASEAVTLVAAIAHAVHGAIGVTEEYDLQLYTRRMHEWRMAHGSEAHWNRVVGEALLAQPSGTIADFVRGACGGRAAPADREPE